MITLESAAALLMVSTGLTLLIIISCAALQYSRVRLAPHSDCKRFNAQLTLQVDDLIEKFKHQGRLKGGRASGEARAQSSKDRTPAATEPGPYNGDEWEAVQERLANSRRLG